MALAKPVKTPSFSGQGRLSLFSNQGTVARGRRRLQYQRMTGKAPQDRPHPSPTGRQGARPGARRLDSGSSCAKMEAVATVVWAAWVVLEMVSPLDRLRCARRNGRDVIMRPVASDDFNARIRFQPGLKRLSRSIWQQIDRATCRRTSFRRSCGSRPHDASHHAPSPTGMERGRKASTMGPLPPRQLGPRG